MMPKKKKDNKVRNLLVGGSLAGLGAGAYLLSKGKAKPVRKVRDILAKSATTNQNRTVREILTDRVNKVDVAPKAPQSIPDPWQGNTTQRTTALPDLPPTKPKITKALPEQRQNLWQGNDVTPKPLPKSRVKKLLQKRLKGRSVQGELPPARSPVTADPWTTTSEIAPDRTLVTPPPSSTTPTGLPPSNWRKADVDPFYRRGKDGKKYLVRGHNRRVKRALNDEAPNAKRIVDTVAKEAESPDPWKDNVQERVNVSPDTPPTKKQGRVKGKGDSPQLPPGRSPVTHDPWDKSVQQRTDVSPNKPTIKPQGKLKGKSGYTLRLNPSLNKPNTIKEIFQPKPKVRFPGIELPVTLALPGTYSDALSGLKRQLQAFVRDPSDVNKLPIPDLKGLKERALNKGLLLPSQTLDDTAQRTFAKRVREAQTNLRVRQSTFQQLVEETKQLSRSIETDALGKIATDKQNFETVLEGLKKNVKQYRPDDFPKQPRIVDSVEKLNQLKKDLDRYVNDPIYADDFFNQNKSRVGEITEQINTELVNVRKQLNAKKVYEQKIADAQRRLAKLREQFTAQIEVEKTLKQNQTDNLRLRIENEINVLEKLKPEEIVGSDVANPLLTPDDIANLNKQKSEWITQYKKFLSRKNYGNDSPFEKKLYRYKEQLNKARLSTKYRGEKDVAKWVDYEQQLIDLQKQVDSLPLSKNKLTRQQKSILRQTEQARKEFARNYPEIIAKVEQLEVNNREFTKQLDKIKTQTQSQVDYIFSNDFVDNYTNTIEKDIRRVDELFEKTKRNVELVDKLKDPSTIENYVASDPVDIVKSLGSSDITQTSVKDVATNLTYAVRAKNVILNGRVIGRQAGKVVRSPGVVDALNRDLDELDYLLRNRNAKKVLTNAEKLLQKQEEQIRELYSSYQRQQNILASELKQTLSNPGKFVYARSENNLLSNLQERILDSGEKTIGVQRLLGEIDSTKAHLKNLAEIAPQYNKLDTIVDLSSTTKQDALIKSVLDGDVGENKPLIRYVQKLKEWTGEINKKRRYDVQQMYYALEESGLSVEGRNSLFDKIYNTPSVKALQKSLTADERTFFNQLSKEQRNLFIEFAKSGVHKDFEKYYYSNAVRFVLTRNVDKQLGFPVEVLKKAQGVSSLTENVQKLLGKRNENVSLIKSKTDDVLKTTQELNSLLKNLGESEVKVVGYVRDSSGKKIPLRGFLAVENLPQVDNVGELGFKGKLVNTVQKGLGMQGKPVVTVDDALMRKSELVGRLRRLLGVTESGLPNTDPVRARELGGVGIFSREELVDLLGRMKSGGFYERSSLNTMLLANQINFNEVKKRADNMYVYNFSQMN